MLGSRYQPHFVSTTLLQAKLIQLLSVEKYMNSQVINGIEWCYLNNCYYAKIAGVRLRVELAKGMTWLGTLHHHNHRGWLLDGHGTGDSKAAALASTSELARLLYVIPGASSNPWRCDVTSEVNKYYARLDSRRTLCIDSAEELRSGYYVVLRVLGVTDWSELRRIHVCEWTEKSNTALFETKKEEALKEMIQYAAMLYPERLSPIPDTIKVK